MLRDALKHRSERSLEAWRSAGLAEEAWPVPMVWRWPDSKALADCRGDAWAFRATLSSALEPDIIGGALKEALRQLKVPDTEAAERTSSLTS